MFRYPRIYFVQSGPFFVLCGKTTAAGKKYASAAGHKLQLCLEMGKIGQKVELKSYGKHCLLFQDTLSSNFVFYLTLFLSFFFLHFLTSILLYLGTYFPCTKKGV